MRALFFTFWVLIVGLLAAPAAAEGRAPIHVQVVLDSSGSMEKSDPRHLSLLAGMIFSDLAGPQDSLGILSMRKGKFVEERLSAIKSRRKQVRDAVRTLPFLGSTFCAEPLHEAAAGLASQAAAEPDARQFVIFFSDGECPDPDAVREAAVRLRDAKVQVFSIGLFDAGASPEATAALRSIAAITGGEFFGASSAAQLPQHFAAILGRIVGSEAVDLTLEPGADAMAELDGYVYDASLIVTGSGPVVIEKAERPDGTALQVPAKPNYAITSAAFHVASFDNGYGRHYSVLRIEEPAAGNWKFRVRGPPDVAALLIQNYALDPVVEAAAQKPVFAVGESCEVRAWLRGKGGERITDAKFLERVEFTATIKDPSGKETAVTLKPGKDGMFVGTHPLAMAGKWSLRGRSRMKSGGLDKRSAETAVEARAAKLSLAADHPPFDLGSVPAGSTSGPHTIDLGGSELPAPVELTLALQGADGVRLEPRKLDAGPQVLQHDVNFTIELDHAGGPLDGQLVVSMGDATVTIAVRGEVIPLSFWERWGRLILTVGIGLLILLVVLFIIHGFVSPHTFPTHLRLEWGETVDRLDKNSIVLSKTPKAKRGFRRNAKVILGGTGPRAFLPGGAQFAEIEAVGPARYVIRTFGAPLEEVSRFDAAKTKTLDGSEHPMAEQQIYRVGSQYLRVK